MGLKAALANPLHGIWAQDGAGIIIYNNGKDPLGNRHLIKKSEISVPSLNTTTDS
jgi:hypothetical protein